MSRAPALLGLPLALLLRAGVDSRLDVYPGERHSFVPQWQESIERTVRFLRRRLG